MAYVFIWLLGYMFTYGLMPNSKDFIAAFRLGLACLFFWPLALGVAIREMCK